MLPTTGIYSGCRSGGVPVGSVIEIGVWVSPGPGSQGGGGCQGRRGSPLAAAKLGVSHGFVRSRARVRPRVSGRSGRLVTLPYGPVGRPGDLGDSGAGTRRFGDGRRRRVLRAAPCVPLQSSRSG